MKPEPTPSFEQAAKSERRSFLGEFWYFARHNKKWWITPILLLLVLAGVLVVLSGGGLAPFIYSLF